jgi:hypothetical protein
MFLNILANGQIGQQIILQMEHLVKSLFQNGGLSHHAKQGGILREREFSHIRPMLKW